MTSHYQRWRHHPFANLGSSAMNLARRSLVEPDPMTLELLLDVPTSFRAHWPELEIRHEVFINSWHQVEGRDVGEGDCSRWRCFQGGGVGQIYYAIRFLLQWWLSTFASLLFVDFS